MATNATKQFLRGSAPALRALEEMGTTTRSAHKVPAAASAAATEVVSKRSRSDGDMEDDTLAASSGFELLLWLTMQLQLLLWETQDSVAPVSKGGGHSGFCAGWQPAAGANRGSSTALGQAQAATQLRAARASHGETEAM